MKRAYIVFRFLAFLCIVIVIILSYLYYRGTIVDKNFLIANGIAAILAAGFGIFANKPVQKEDVAIAIDEVLLTYDEKTFNGLKKAKEEEKIIKQFIEYKSNEIFLVKLRSHLEEEIKTKYQNSELAKLVEDLQSVEKQLDAINVKYDPSQLPERFNKIIFQLNEQERMDFFLDMLKSVPLFPFPFFVAFMKAMISFRYNFQRIFIKHPQRSSQQTK